MVDTDNDEYLTTDDGGTVLKPEEAAIILLPNGCFRALIPKMAPDEEVPRHVFLLGAILLKMGDDEWCQDMIDECLGNNEWCKDL